MAVYNKENFLAHAAQLIPTGFTQVGDESIYEKVDGNRILRMVVTSDDYFPHSATFTGVSSRIVFTEIEDVFKEILKDNPISGRSITNTYATIKGVTIDESQVDYDFFYDNGVEDDATFEVIRPMHQILVDEGLQFFDQFQTLDQVYEYIESLDDDNKGKFISQPSDLRYTIIKKLVNASDWETYLLEGIDYYKSKDRLEYVNFLKALYQKFKS